MAISKATNLPAPILSTQPPKGAGSSSLRKVTTLGRLMEPIAKVLNESLAGVVINAATCVRMLARNPANVAGAHRCARRGIRDASRAAEAVSRLHDLLREKDMLCAAIRRSKRRQGALPRAIR